jgi:hypothetical protein
MIKTTKRKQKEKIINKFEKKLKCNNTTLLGTCSIGGVVREESYTDFGYYIFELRNDYQTIFISNLPLSCGDEVEIKFYYYGFKIKGNMHYVGLVKELTKINKCDI